MMPVGSFNATIANGTSSNSGSINHSGSPTARLGNCSIDATDGEKSGQCEFRSQASKARQMALRDESRGEARLPQEKWRSTIRTHGAGSDRDSGDITGTAGSGYFRDDL